MCGINGFIGEDAKKIEIMNATVSHRGPDAMGAYVSGGVSLGHTRLSIIDTSKEADQPMVDEAKRFVIIFNGEIYNFKALKAELAPHHFKTSSDTEVLLAGYNEWGNALFRKLNGIFAIAIFDTQEKTLTLARDKMGVKPLYYFHNEGTFMFSSEIKALIATGDISRTLHMESFDAYMRLLYVPGNETLFKNILRIPPGSCVKYEDGNLITVDFTKEQEIRKKVNKNDVRNVIDEAIERQLVSDRPLGIYLSGGIDSSVVLDAVSKIRDNVKTFSIGFDLEESEQRAKFNKDFDLAATTAEFYGADHTGFLIKKSEVLPALEQAVRHLDEPIANPTIIPMILLAERVKEQGIDAVLGGDGADEMFGGYIRYRWAKVRDVYWFFTSKVLRNFFEHVHPVFKKLNDKTAIDQYGRFMFQKESVVKTVMGDAYRSGTKFKEQFRDNYLERYVTAKNMMQADTKTWLVNESLLRSDKLSMAHGLELRVPFLDNEVVDVATHAHTYQKVGLFSTKKILKKAFRDRLPAYLFKQPKRGWFSPGAKWLRDPEIYEYAKTVLKEGYHPATDGLFNWVAVQIMLDEHVDGTKYNATMLWAVLVFRMWAKEFNIIYEK